VMLGGNQGQQVKLAAYKESLFKAFVLPEGFEGESYELPEMDKHFKADTFDQTR